MIATIQILCCGILIVQYLPQIDKIHKRKGSKDVSITMYIARISSTLISCYTLTLSNNQLIVVISQYVSLALSLIVLSEMLYYIAKKHLAHNKR